MDTKKSKQEVRSRGAHDVIGISGTCFTKMQTFRLEPQTEHGYTYGPTGNGYVSVLKTLSLQMQISWGQDLCSLKWWGAKKFSLIIWALWVGYPWLHFLIESFFLLLIETEHNWQAVDQLRQVSSINEGGFLRTLVISVCLEKTFQLLKNILLTKKANTLLKWLYFDLKRKLRRVALWEEEEMKKSEFFSCLCC